MAIPFFMFIFNLYTFPMYGQNWYLCITICITNFCSVCSIPSWRDRSGAMNTTPARRSKIPVLCKEYRSRLTEIREKQLIIEAKDVELRVLKQILSKLTLKQQGCVR